MATILDRILATKRREVQEAQQRVPASELERQCATMPESRDFHGELARTNKVRIIAEVKKASPSAGVIRADFDPVKIAQAYAAGGAACLSVLTDREYFQGDLQFLRDIRHAVDLPLLRKDFVIDRYQLLEARAAGADCVLLIAECLSPTELLTLHREAVELGLQTLIELYDAENLPAVLATGGRLVGVNNRDLRSFQVDLGHTIRMRQEVPVDRLLVGESGIRTVEDVARLGQAGVKAILVGESLMRQENVQSAVAELADVSVAC